MQLVHFGLALEHSLSHVDAQVVTLPTRLGYYRAKDPHLVRGVIGSSAHFSHTNSVAHSLCRYMLTTTQ